MLLTALCPVPLPPAPALPVEVLIGPGVRHQLAEVVARHAGAGPVVVVCDPHTAAAAGTLALGAHRIHQLAAHPHADVESIEALRPHLADAGLTVAVGSGTVNDLVKRASALEGDRPFVILATASSMNGYASAIAAILDAGVKTTVPCRPARAVILDTEILGAAPAALTRAGIGDLMSKPVSDSDWWLGDQLEGTGYSGLPSQIVDAAVLAVIQHAAGLVPEADTETSAAAHAALGQALVLSGVAMVVAGSSSPASGGEHLLSHLWDMQAVAEGRETRLHGAQVGVATLISAALYQRILSREVSDLVDPPSWDSEAERIEREHGVLAAAVLPHAQRKHARAAARVATLRARWPEIRAGLAARNLPKPEQIRAVLSAAQAPVTLAGLGTNHTDGARILRLARDMRDRVTVLDLAFDLGVLPGAAEAILAEAGV